MTSRNLYDDLGVATDADDATIKRAKRRRSTRAYAPKREDLVGRKFGLITVTASAGVASDYGKKGNTQYVHGLCECGGTWTGRADCLKRGNTKSCGCIHPGNRPHPNRERPAFNSVLKNYKHHAERRGHAWELSRERFDQLVRGSCYYCGCVPATTSRILAVRKRRTGSEFTYNGIDRMDNARGYIEGNVVSCCKTCNYAKRDLSAVEFIAHVRRIHLFQFGADKTEANAV
jgi:hypothetical protein